jgi:hypothetical protein
MKELMRHEEEVCRRVICRSLAAPGAVDGGLDPKNECLAHLGSLGRAFSLVPLNCHSVFMIERPICDLSSSENINDFAGLVDEDGGTVFCV